MPAAMRQRVGRRSFPAPPSNYVGPLGQSGSWNLDFIDDFDGSSVDTNKWKTDGYWWGDGTSGTSNNSNDEDQLYLPSQLSVANSVLTITAQKENNTRVFGGNTYNYTWKSGCITSGPNGNSSGIRYEYTYGYAEFKMKWPAGNGFWPAGWGQQASGTRSWPPEIDFMEALGHDRFTSLHHFHYNNGGHQDSGRNKTSAVDLTADYHIYGCDWTPNWIRWYVDGVEATPAFTQTAFIPNVPLYLLFNLAVGGAFPDYAGFPPDGTTPSPASLLLDWVKVWKRA